MSHSVSQSQPAVDLYHELLQLQKTPSDRKYFFFFFGVQVRGGPPARDLPLDPEELGLAGRRHP